MEPFKYNPFWAPCIIGVVIEVSRLRATGELHVFSWDTKDDWKKYIDFPEDQTQYIFRVKSLKPKENYVGERSYSPPAY